MTIQEIFNTLQLVGKPVHTPDQEITELSIDSRKIGRPEGVLFFALKTLSNDGHRYIPELIRRGVRHFVVTQSTSELCLDEQTLAQASICNFLQVNDVLTALQQLVSSYRQQFHCPTIGITGSNGKTIIKEWLSGILAVDHHITYSPDSYNSQLGVPLSVWQLRKETELAIFEAGISKPGEMEKLARVICPTIGILTNIGAAHAQFFHNSEEKAKEKLKLFRHADLLIYHDDNPILNRLLQQPEYQHLQKISWGSSRALYPVTNRHIEGHQTLVTLDGYCFHIPFLDSASVENTLHVIVTLRVLHYPCDQIEAHIAHLSRISMRTEILEGLNHSILINDTYSLDINSLGAALDFMDTQNQLANKTLILSDFEQVGKFGTSEYEQLNALLQQHHIGTLITIGEQFQAHIGSMNIPQIYSFPYTDALLQQLDDLDFSYQLVLIKGARSFHFERIVRRLQHKTHPTILNVSLPALIHNLQYYRSLLKPETKIVAMVKAHSYGLGDAELINELVQQHIDYLAVAYTDEGVRLRKRHIQTPIIVLGAEAHSYDVMIQHHLEPEIFNLYYLHELTQELKRGAHTQPCNIHLKLDTGMHRLGFDEGDLPKLIETIQVNPQLRIASIFTHLAAADDPNEDAFTQEQISRFKRMSSLLTEAFDYPILRHILNSSGIERFTESQFEMVRLGIGLYGFSNLPDVQTHLQNVATLKTVITQVKNIPAGETIGYNRSFHLEHDTQVAIIPIGYADGYPRELSNGVGTVLIQGHQVPVIGKVCMDMCMLDVSGLVVHEGDEVIVYGEGNTAAEMAQRAGLISYELLTRLSQRVPRVYVRE